MINTISFFILILISSYSLALPKAIILLRHGEKPPFGNELNDRGWQRAKALPEIFEKVPELKELGKPDYLFAAGLRKLTNSLRSIQTLKFVSEKFGIPIDRSYIRDRYQSLIDELKKNEKFNGKIVVLCWEHDRIKDMLPLFGLERKKMKGSVFDRIWLITFDKNSKAVFADLPQNLLSGDSSN